MTGRELRDKLNRLPDVFLDMTVFVDMGIYADCEIEVDTIVDDGPGLMVRLKDFDEPAFTTGSDGNPIVTTGTVGLPIKPE